VIEIINYERINDGKKIGYVDIYLPKRKEFISHILHLQSGERKWFALPSYAKQMPDGKYKYFPFWKLENELHNQQLLEALSDPVKKYCAAKGIKDVEQLNLNFEIDEQIPF
jgi:hypothetical protein